MTDPLAILLLYSTLAVLVVCACIAFVHLLATRRFDAEQVQWDADYADARRQADGYRGTDPETRHVR